MLDSILLHRDLDIARKSIREILCAKVYDGYQRIDIPEKVIARLTDIEILEQLLDFHTELDDETELSAFENFLHACLKYDVIWNRIPTHCLLDFACVCQNRIRMSLYSRIIDRDDFLS